MSNDLTLEWHADTRQLHCNGVFRATPTDINRWRKTQPPPDSIINHISNTSHVGVGKWWNIQAMHYGLRIPKHPTVGQVLDAFKASLVNGNPIVSPSIRALEQIYASRQATKQPFAQASPNEAVANTQTGLQPIRAGSRRHPVRYPSQLVNTSTQESIGRLNLKREADSNFEQRPNSRRHKHALFLNSKEWHPQNNPTTDPFLSQRHPAATNTHPAKPNPHSANPFRPVAPADRESLEAGEIRAEVPAKAVKQEAQSETPSKHNGIEASLRNNQEDAISDASGGISEATSLDGTEKSDSPAQEGAAPSIHESDNTSPTTMSKTTEILQGSIDHALSQEVEANSPSARRVGPAGVTFYHNKKDGWSVSCQWSGFSENRGFLIYGHPKSTSTRWLQPFSRATRWAENDHDMVFYYAQLLHRGLLETRSKEVARWRLKTRAQVDKTILAVMDSIKTKLFMCLSQNIEALKSGKIKSDSQKPSFTEDKNNDTQPWMVEKPKGVLTETSAYEMVMRKWLDSRTKYEFEIESVSHVNRATKNDDDLIPSKCRICNHKYRLCTCDFCDACGELEADCDCEKCNNCRLRVEFCSCEDCDSCKRKYNVELKIYCYCFCQKCGVKYSFDCLSPIDGENQFVRLNSTLCECALSWPQARDLGHRLKKEQEERQRTFARQVIEKAAANRVVKWIQQNQPEYFAQSSEKQNSRHLSLSDVCGTYELTWELGGEASVERSELLVSSDCETLWGRGRFGAQLHGLFRTNRIPSYSSTEPVECQMAVQPTGGSWSFDNPSRSKTSITFDGIIFLGNGLILMETSGFTPENTQVILPSNPVFGVKTSQVCEDVDALKESWFAVHDSCCTCTSIKSEANGDAPTALHSKWRPVMAEGSTKPWDESLVDRLVDRLRCSGNAPPASAKVLVGGTVGRAASAVAPSLPTTTPASVTAVNSSPQANSET